MFHLHIDDLKSYALLSMYNMTLLRALPAHSRQGLGTAEGVSLIY